MRTVGTLLLFLLLLVPLVGPAARAESGLTISLPVPTKVNRNNLLIDVDSRWVEANGYRPVRFTIRPTPAPFAAARRVQMVLSLGENWGPTHYNVVVRDYIELPAGATSAEKTVLVPQRGESPQLKFEFFEDGYRLTDLEYLGSGMAMMRNIWTEASPAVLFIDDDTPARSQRDSLVKLSASPADAPVNLMDVRTIRSQIADPYNTTNASQVPVASQAALKSTPTTDLATLLLIQNDPRLQMLPLAELPDEMLGFSCFDVVVIDFDDAQTLFRRYPDKWRALTQWIRSGTSLIVHDLQAEPTRRDAFDRMLRAFDGDSLWQEPDRDGRDDKNRISATVQTQYAANPYMPRATSSVSAVSGNSAKSEATVASESPPEKADFHWRSYGAGRVFGVERSESLQSPWQVGWMLNAIGTDQQWFERHGLSLNRRNDDFWNWLVRGVGRPPVIAFLVLISLFMIIVGPVNYLFLRARGKLYLLLFTVPAAALMVTLSLLGYVVLSDGLGIKWRCRSLTYLDQTQSTAVAWARHSYFAGLPPTGGLTFSRQTAVYPLIFEPPNRYQNSSPTRKVEWTDQQRLIAGYLPSRTTTQLLTVRSGGSDAKLEIQESNSPANPPVIVNRLNTRIIALVIRASGGQFWGTSGSANDLVMTAANQDDLQKQMETLISSRQPVVEMRVDPSRSWNRWFGVDVDSSVAAQPRTNSSLLERRLQALANGGIRTMRPRSYVAIVERSPFVEAGYATVEELDGFHVVLGIY